MRLSAKSLLFPLFLLFGGTSSLPAETPFAVGERLTYTLKWGIVTAGTAVLEVHPVTEIEGEEVFHFSLTVRTTSFVDRFYKVRDRIDGFASKDMNGSVLYLLKKEGKNPRDVRVTYRVDEGLAQYSNFGKEKKPVRMFPGTWDPLSVVYAFRMLPFGGGGSGLEMPVSDGKRSAMGLATIGSKERVKVPAGKFQTVLVQPDMQDVGGVFDKSGDSPLKIWFSQDARRLPVRVSSRVSVGSFRADLVSVEQVPVKEQVALVD